MSLLSIGIFKKIFVRKSTNWPPFIASVHQKKHKRSNKTTRYLVLYDGEQKKKCLVASQCVDLLSKIKKGDLIHVINYSCTFLEITEKKNVIVLVLTDFKKIDNIELLNS